MPQIDTERIHRSPGPQHGAGGGGAAPGAAVATGGAVRERAASSRPPRALDLGRGPLAACRGLEKAETWLRDSFDKAGIHGCVSYQSQWEPN